MQKNNIENVKTTDPYEQDCELFAQEIKEAMIRKFEAELAEAEKNAVEDKPEELVTIISDMECT